MLQRNIVILFGTVIFVDVVKKFKFLEMENGNRQSVKYTGFRLKKETMKELVDLRKAYSLSYGKDFSNDEFVHQLIASVEGGDPSVWDFFCQLREVSEKLEMKARERVSKE